jgi:hypothetical protein
LQLLHALPKWGKTLTPLVDCDCLTRLRPAFAALLGSRKLHPVAAQRLLPSACCTAQPAASECAMRQTRSPKGGCVVVCLCQCTHVSPAPLSQPPPCPAPFTGHSRSVCFQVRHGVAVAVSCRTHPITRGFSVLNRKPLLPLHPPPLSPPPVKSRRRRHPRTSPPSPPPCIPTPVPAAAAAASHSRPILNFRRKRYVLQAPPPPPLPLPLLLLPLLLLPLLLLTTPCSIPLQLRRSRAVTRPAPPPPPPAPAAAAHASPGDTFRLAGLVIEKVAGRV